MREFATSYIQPIASSVSHAASSQNRELAASWIIANEDIVNIWSKLLFLHIVLIIFVNFTDTVLSHFK